MPKSAAAPALAQSAYDLESPTNGGKSQIEMGTPYTAHIELQGVCPIIFHRWNVESIGVKGEAAKGSKAKKSDDVESYIWRDEEGYICLPGEYVRQSVIHAAKYKQDPRSPRKSMMDLTKAAIFALEPLVPLIGAAEGKKTKKYEMLDQRRMVVQRAGITRSRPAFHAGWKANLSFQVVLPEYIQPSMLQDLLSLAGRIVGLADSRPSYGRFSVTKFQTSEI